MIEKEMKKLLSLAKKGFKASNPFWVVILHKDLTITIKIPYYATLTPEQLQAVYAKVLSEAGERFEIIGTGIQVYKFHAFVNNPKVGSSKDSYVWVKIGVKPKIEQHQVYIFVKSGNKVKTIAQDDANNWVVERIDGKSVGKQMIVPEKGLVSLENWRFNDK